MNVLERGSGCLALVIALGVGGCGAEVDSSGQPESLQHVQSDLQVGSTGEGVRAVHAYLMKYGYFPNPELAAKYPEWRPVVAEPPAQLDTFDEQTAEAVRGVQKSLGLPTTGIVDAATRTALMAHRCGVPDGIAEVDPSNKFALGGTRWGSSGGATVRWRVNNTNDVQIAEARAAAAAAFRAWAEQSSLTFVQETGTAAVDIDITFGTIDSGGDGTTNTLASAFQPGSGGDITVDTFETWSVTVPTPAGAVDLQAVLTHEIGHALGLRHSSIANATMLPNFFFGYRTLDLDDKVAISAIYDTFGTLTGAARDIGVGANGTIWIIGRDAHGDGWRVYRWNGSGWTSTDGGAARIAVGPTGIPWLVTSDGSIFRRTTTNPATLNAWELLPGRAHDIGVGANGDAWVIGRDAHGSGFRVYKWNGSTWIGTDGGGVKISVGPTGIPWILTSNNEFFRRTTTNPATLNAWERLPGISTDLAINGGNYLWSIGAVSSGQENLSVWNEQSTLGTAPQRKDWTPGKRMGVGGANCALSVGPTGRPFMVDQNGSIFTSIDGAP